MEMFWAIVLFVVGLVALIYGGDWFVDGAVGVAHRFHLPEFLIGATVVSIGTTIPEVMVSSLSAAEGNGAFAYGNAIGSVICNTALIAALTVAVRPGKVDGKAFRIPVLFFFLSAAFYIVISYTSGFFARWVGVMLLAVFVCYMVLTVLQMKKNPVEAEAAEGEAAEAGKDKPLWKDLLMLVLGAAAIAVGANLLVDNGTFIAETLNVPKTVISLTFVALGTSLPELITAITSLIKGHSSLSLGNIIGANLFNLVLVSGLSITIKPFQIPAEKLVGGMNASLVVDLPVMMAVMLILTVPTLIRGKLSRVQGISLLAIYAAFCVFQFVL